MLFLWWAILAASFLSGRTVVDALDSSSTSLLSRDGSDIQVLTAITIRSELERRDIDFTPKYTLEHHYADHVSLLRGTSARFAKTSTRFKIPALALEEIESHLENIECYHSFIVLKFVNEVALRQAKGQWDSLSKFIVISSHPGCNGDGQRALYVVSDINYSTIGATVVLSTYRIEWKAAYASMKVDFGMTDESPGDQYSSSGIRLHDNIHLRLSRRQAFASDGGQAAPSSTDGQATPSSTDGQAAAPSTIVYPSAPTSTPSGESSVKNISFSFIDQPSIISWNQMQNNIGCKNCSLASSVEITHGTFIINSSAISNFEKTCPLGHLCQVIEEATQFVQYGFFNVAVNGFSAHIELNNSILVSTSQFFSQDIFSIGLPGFQIPDIAVVGPQYNVAIVGSVDIASQVNFTYGFDLTIPDGSSINIEIGNLTNSTQQGFSNSTIVATPFSASTDATNLTLSLGLRSAVLLGVDVLSGQGSIYAGIFIDLPSVSVNISTLEGVNVHCEPLTSSNTLNGLLSHVFPKLTNIVPSVNISFGLEAGAELDVAHLNLNTQSVVASTTLAGTVFPLQTACLSWDEKATKFVEPAFTTTSATVAAAGATGTGSQSGGQKAGTTGGQSGNFGTGLRDRNPFAQTTGVIWAMFMALGCIVFSFDVS